MNKYFIQPKDDELSQSVIENENAALEALSEASNNEFAMASEQTDSPKTRDFGARWRALREKPLEDIFLGIVQEFKDQPAIKHDVLATWLARELGYRRFIRRKDKLVLGPFWYVLSPSGYQTLGPRGQGALWYIAQTSPARRASLNPIAALAAIALWKNSDNPALRQDAQTLLISRALPDEPRWLYNLIRALSDDPVEIDNDTADDDSTASHDILRLAQLQLRGQFWDITAHLIGLHFVRHYNDWYSGVPSNNLMKACRIAAEQYPQRWQSWLQTLVDATTGGQLTYAWLEFPLRAAIRLSLDDTKRQETLRQFYAKRLLDASHEELDEFYQPLLEQLQTDDPQQIVATLEKLLVDVDTTLINNPIRAQRLAELIAIYLYPKRIGGFLTRLTFALRQISNEEQLSMVGQYLLAIYVRNYTIELPAVDFVRQNRLRIEWSLDYITPRDMEMYLMISDYERAFEHLTCKFDGVTMDYADKNAAASIKYFIEKRVRTSRVQNAVRQMFKPVEWLSGVLVQTNVITSVVEKGMQLFEARLQKVDLTDEVMNTYQQQGIELESFADIENLTVDKINETLKNQRKKRMLLGALAGGVSGSLAPFSWGLLSLTDVPVVLSITADLCSRFCWFYGFDPRQDPNLPLEILAVALGGSRPDALEPMLVRQNLHEYVIQKSVMVGAVTQGSFRHIASRGLVNAIEKQLGSTSAQKISALAKREVSKNLQRRTLRNATSKTLPVVGAILGAGLNAALLYDICEAAQAVLTDRFLERKYPEWARQFTHDEALMEITD